ncbi:O-linked N-acetylglucosamine transferase, SPINDLY family protein [Sulfurirhabdus autotrophica]|nr:tetratricopeptide repeat protein [Sulfurirhabdus autotrophica]
MKKVAEHVQRGAFAEAKTLLEQVCKVDRVDAEAWFMLGVVNWKLELPDEALTCLHLAVRLRPDHALSHYNLGTIFRAQGRLEDAVQSFGEVLRLDPSQMATYETLKAILLELDRAEDAARCHLEMLKRYPLNADTYASKGSMLHILSRLEEAADCYRKALQLKPGSASLHDSLASALCVQGQYKEAIENHRIALQLDPGNYQFHSNFLLTLQYSPGIDSAEIFDEHCSAAKAYAFKPIKEVVYANKSEPERRLRVGYVSSDFRLHSVAFFLEPLLEAHDANHIEIFCYSGVSHPDVMTHRMQNIAHHWRDISSLSDEQVAAMVNSDGIDILVDLAGYTGGCRLGLFAQKPAPLQVSWLGYLDTTGLETMDYRLTDSFVDSHGRDSFYVESLIRLPGCFLCYKPFQNAPEVAMLPALGNNFVTFGSFNALPKINEEVVALWGGVLNAVPRSRLFIKSSALTDRATSERYYNLFESQGVGRDRVELIGHTVTQQEHLDLYKRIDIALDTFPYNGATTTCEALWMGVPVITLAGVRNSSRMGLSLLNSVGMQGWIAETPEQYLEIAVKMSADLSNLSGLRSGLRERVATSPLTDGKSFAKKIENVYREIWCKWCA